MNNVYYRPQWTCGRYNRLHKAAIIYNLIEGLCLYFEDVSAEVMGCILSIKRNHPFTIEQLSKESDVSMDSLHPFISQLEQYGLITHAIPTQDDIDTYRQNLRQTRHQLVMDNMEEMHEKSLVGTGFNRLFFEGV